MKIVVCIKQVPDTTEVKLDPVTHTLNRAGLPSIINHDDKSAIEAALQLREKSGGTVSVVSMGPPQAELALREALAMGADEAYLLTAREFGGSDTWATAYIIAKAVDSIGYDVVFAGRQAIDGDTAQVGPQIAENLGIPQVSYVERFEENGGVFKVWRQYEDRTHILEVKGKCLFTFLAETISPRYMSVGGIVDAFQKEIKTITFETLKDKLNPEFIGLKGSPTNVVRAFDKIAKGAGEVKKGLSADEAVAAIMAKLEEKHII